MLVDESHGKTRPFAFALLRRAQSSFLCLLDLSKVLMALSREVGRRMRQSLHFFAEKSGSFAVGFGFDGAGGEFVMDMRQVAGGRFDGQAPRCRGWFARRVASVGVRTAFASVKGAAAP